MEIHALKSYLPERASKDYNDVLALLQNGWKYKYRVN